MDIFDVNWIDQLDEITKKHADKIKDNEKLQQHFNNLSKENDKKNTILKELANASKLTYEYAVDVMEYASTLSNIVLSVDKKLSALEITINRIEKGNHHALKLFDNLQDQIDTLAGEIAELKENEFLRNKRNIESLKKMENQLDGE